MIFVLLTGFTLAVSASDVVEVESLKGYHETVGIPMAKRIKEAEDKLVSAQARIVGGRVAPPNAHPYLAGLLITFLNSFGTSTCGSSLISRNRLVTAAHCWYDGRMQANRFIVVLGTHFLYYGGTRIVTSNVVVHPWWNPSILRNDVAMVYLPYPVQTSATIQPIELPHQYLWQSFVGEWATAAGYGTTRDFAQGVPISSVVSHIDLQVIPLKQCSLIYGYQAQPSNICTSGAGGVGVCSGDSGGPLFIVRNGQRILVGISSFVSASGCRRGLPSVFSRVTAFYNFIMQHM